MRRRWSSKRKRRRQKKKKRGGEARGGRSILPEKRESKRKHGSVHLAKEKETQKYCVKKKTTK